VKGQGQRDR